MKIKRVLLTIVGSICLVFSLPLFLAPAIGIEPNLKVVAMLSASLVAYIFGIACIHYVGEFKSWKISSTIGIAFPVIVLGSFIGALYAIEEIFNPWGKQGIYEAAIISCVVSILSLRSLIKYLEGKYA